MKNINLIKRAVVAGIAGAVVGAIIVWFFAQQSFWKWILVSAVCGIIAGLLWPIGYALVIRLRVEDWRVEQIEIQGIKFSASGMQRRVAWRLFVEIATRVATQPVEEESGDDGVALTSLYQLFQVTRKALTEMEPTPDTTGPTVETYAMDMLNRDLRPFLSKWHPKWDQFAKTGTGAWPLHAEFRRELADIQREITRRAHGLAELAGVQNVDRFFPSPPQL